MESVACQEFQLIVKLSILSPIFYGAKLSSGGKIEKQKEKIGKALG